MPGGKYHDRTPAKKNISLVVRPRKKAPTNKTLNKKIKKIENNLIELKYKDTFNNGSLIPNTGLLINDMNITNAGAAQLPVRDGLEITATSLTYKMLIQSDIDNLVASRVRVVVFWDRQPNGANAILFGDNGLLENNIVTNLVVAPRNYKTIDRYTIIDDNVHVLNPNQAFTVTPDTGITTAVIPITYCIEKYHKLSRQMKYDAAAGAITDCVTNTINVALFSDLAAEQPTLVSGIRLYYKD